MQALTFYIIAGHHCFVKAGGTADGRLAVGKNSQRGSQAGGVLIARGTEAGCAKLHAVV